jgi:hypothetical protein
MPFIVLLIIVTSFMTPILLQASYRKDKMLQELKEYEKMQIDNI